MKELSLKFKNANGKASHLKLRFVSENLTPEIVRAAMQDIVDAKLITDKFGNQSYVKPLSAHYTDTVNTPIFDDEPAKPKAPQV